MSKIFNTHIKHNVLEELTDSLVENEQRIRNYTPSKFVRVNYENNLFKKLGLNSATDAKEGQYTEAHSAAVTVDNIAEGKIVKDNSTSLIAEITNQEEIKSHHIKNLRPESKNKVSVPLSKNNEINMAKENILTAQLAEQNNFVAKKTLEELSQKLEASARNEKILPSSVPLAPKTTPKLSTPLLPNTGELLKKFQSPVGDSSVALKSANAELIHKIKNLENKQNLLLEQINRLETLLHEVPNYFSKLESNKNLPFAIHDSIDTLEQGFGDLVLIVKALLEKIDSSNSVDNSKLNKIFENVTNLNLGLENINSKNQTIVDLVTRVENTVHNKLPEGIGNSNNSDTQAVYTRVEKIADELGANFLTALQEVKSGIEKNLELIAGTNHHLTDEITENTIPHFKEFNNLLTSLHKKIDNLASRQSNNEVIEKLFERLGNKLDHKVEPLKEININLKELSKNQAEGAHNFKTLNSKIDIIIKASEANNKILNNVYNLEDSSIKDLNFKLNNLITQQNDTGKMVTELQNYFLNHTKADLPIGELPDSNIINKLVSEINAFNSKNDSLIKEQNDLAEKMQEDMKYIKQNITDLISTKKAEEKSIAAQSTKKMEAKVTTLAYNSAGLNPEISGGAGQHNGKKSNGNGSKNNGANGEAVIKNPSVKHAISKLKEALDLDTVEFAHAGNFPKDDRTIDEILADKILTSSPKQTPTPKPEEKTKTIVSKPLNTTLNKAFEVTTQSDNCKEEVEALKDAAKATTEPEKTMATINHKADNKTNSLKLDNSMFFKYK